MMRLIRSLFGSSFLLIVIFMLGVGSEARAARSKKHVAATEQPALLAPTINTLTTEQEAEVDGSVSTVLAESGVPAISLAIVRNGKVAYLQAYGVARFADERSGSRSAVGSLPARPAMRFAAGSITKQFTAAAVMLLVQEGKLSLDDKVAKYLPELTRADEVTLRELLSHTSGYSDYFPQDYVPIFMTRDTTVDEILRRWAERPLDFNPGTDWQYSNTNYTILGRIIEQVTGMPYFPFLQQRVLAPAGITDAVAVDEHGLGPGDAVGYTRFALGPPRPAVREGRNWLLAMGDLGVTAQDLAMWDITLMNESLLQPASYKAMETEVKLKDGKGTHYGLGLELLPEKRADGSMRRVVEHSGEVSGFRSENVVYPDDKAAIVVLTNSDYSGASSDVARRLTSIFGLHGGESGAVAPENTAERRARTMLLNLQAGHVDRQELTEDLNAYFTAETLKDAETSLGPLGRPVSVKERDKANRGGMVYRSFVVQFSAVTLHASEFDMPDGKMEQFLVETSE